MAIQLTSAAFEGGERIPDMYTVNGEDISPPLAWTRLPENTRELVLLCEDPDAPTLEPWVHWLMYKIPADTRGISERATPTVRLKRPAGAIHGKNSWPSGQTIGYRGPAPPPGHGVHHYHFRLYAIDAKLIIEPGLDKKRVFREIGGHIIEQGLLVGTYSR